MTDWPNTYFIKETAAIEAYIRAAEYTPSYNLREAVLLDSDLLETQQFEQQQLAPSIITAEVRANLFRCWKHPFYPPTLAEAVGMPVGGGVALFYFHPSFLFLTHHS